VFLGLLLSLFGDGGLGWRHNLQFDQQGGKPALGLGIGLFSLGPFRLGSLEVVLRGEEGMPGYLGVLYRF